MFDFGLIGTMSRTGGMDWLMRRDRSVHRQCRDGIFLETRSDLRSDCGTGQVGGTFVSGRLSFGTSDGHPPEAFDCVPHWTR